MNLLHRAATLVLGAAVCCGLLVAAFACADRLPARRPWPLVAAVALAYAAGYIACWAVEAAARPGRAIHERSRP